MYDNPLDKPLLDRRLHRRVQRLEGRMEQLENQNKVMDYRLASLSDKIKRVLLKLIGW